jgi:hypothetical protein
MSGVPCPFEKPYGHWFRYFIGIGQFGGAYGHWFRYMWENTKKIGDFD